MTDLPVYRVKQTRRGWIVQIKGRFFWKTHWPFGLKEARFYPTELQARWGANVCRSADERQRNRL